MAGTAVVCAIVLLCAVKVRGFDKNAVDGAHAVDGNYDGRFGVEIGVQAVFSQGGITGNVLFLQEAPGDPVQIHVNLMGLDQYTDSYRWSIHEYPVRTSLLRDFPCAEDRIGGVFNRSSVPCNTADSCDVGDLTARLGNIRFDMPWQVFQDPSLSLTGPDSIIGRSLVIDREDGPEGAFICANIEQLGVRREILRAAFDNSIIQGDVIIRYAIGRDDALIEVDLHRVDGNNTNSQGIMWSLNFGVPGPDNSCAGVGLDDIFGATGYKDHLFNCGLNNQRECIIGDLSSKCGDLEFVNGRARLLCTDNQLGSIRRDYLFDKRHPEHALMVVIRDNEGRPLGCAVLEMPAPQLGRAQFRTLSVFGDFFFWQNGPDDRTYVRTHLTGLRGTDYSLRIFENTAIMTHPCDLDELGNVFSKQGGEFILPANLLTNDAGAIGNLDSLLVLVEGQQSLRTTVSSSFLPLFGPYTILGRTLGLVNEETGVVEACNTIMRQEDYPQGELASLLAYQDLNNPPLPVV